MARYPDTRYMMCSWTLCSAHMYVLSRPYTVSFKVLLITRMGLSIWIKLNWTNTIDYILIYIFIINANIHLYAYFLPFINTIVHDIVKLQIVYQNEPYVKILEELRE